MPPLEPEPMPAQPLDPSTLRADEDAAAHQRARLLGEPRGRGPDPSSDAVERGSALGRFLVLGELGRGGMGTVLKAYDESLDRAVAIKLLRDDVEQHADRLHREALALARLSHPNVVQVYEVDEAQGRVFMAMELVEGPTLRAWQQRQSWQRCVEVYLQAGAGLAAAHEAGLVHCDFKPDNCIVDPRGRARVLDFGLVKGRPPSNDGSHVPCTASERSSPRGSSRSTEAGTVVGTPAYMAPEQIDGREADSHSDQFAFCVALFEAVYGVRPFDGQSLPQIRAAQEEGRIAAAPRDAGVPTRLHALLLRGLAPRPSSRWASMDALLIELRLLLVRRRRWLGLGATAAVLTLGLGLTRYAEVSFLCTGAEDQLAGVWDESRKAEVRDAMLAAERGYARDVWTRTVEPALDSYARSWAAEHEEVCAATSIRGEQSTALMDLRMGCLAQRRRELSAIVTVLSDADDEVVEEAPEIVATLESLERCADVDALRAEVAPPDPSERQAIAEVRGLLADARVEHAAGRYAAALRQVEQAEKRAASLRYEPVRSEISFEEARILEGLGELGRAESRMRRALELAARARRWPEVQRAASALMAIVGATQQQTEEGLRYREVALGLLDGRAETEADTRRHLGAVFHRMGRYEDAEQQHRRALALWGEAASPRHPEIARIYNDLAIALNAQGRAEEAEAEQRRAIALWEEIAGPEHPETARSRTNLGTVLMDLGKLEEAEQQYRSALAIVERALGPRNRQIAEILTNLASLSRLRGAHEEAEQQYRTALELWRVTAGLDHPGAATCRAGLAVLLGARGRHREAEEELRRALDTAERALGADHPKVAELRSGLALILVRLGRHADAEEEIRRALPLLEARLPSTHPDVIQARVYLANIHFAQGHYQEAEAEQRAILALREQRWGSGHQEIAEARLSLAMTLHAAGKYEEATLGYRRTLDEYVNTVGPRHLHVATTRNGLANALRAQGRLEEAEREHRLALELREALLGPAHPHTATSHHNLGNILRDQGRGREAIAEYRESLAAFQETLGDDHPYVASSRSSLGAALLERGDAEEALHLGELAWQRRRQPDVAAEDQAETAFLMARALWRISERRACARVFGQLAVERMTASETDDEKAVAELERWLRKHPPLSHQHCDDPPSLGPVAEGATEPPR